MWSLSLASETNVSQSPEGVIEQVGREQQAAPRHVEALVVLAASEPVRVLELDARSRGQEVVRVPARLEQVLFDRHRRRPGALQQADATCAGAVHQVDHGADHPRMHPLGRARGMAAEPQLRRSGQVELDAHRAPLDEALEPAELVEHAVERRHELGAVADALADRHRCGGSGAGPGRESCRAEPGGGARGDELSA